MLSVLVARLSLPSIEEIRDINCTNVGLNILTNSSIVRIPCNRFTSWYYMNKVLYLQYRAKLEHPGHQAILDTVVYYGMDVRNSQRSSFSHRTEGDHRRQFFIDDHYILTAKDTPDNRISNAIFRAYEFGRTIRSIGGCEYFINTCNGSPIVEQSGDRYILISSKTKITVTECEFNDIMETIRNRFTITKRAQ